jgi:multidrug resistance efflux pump
MSIPARQILGCLLALLLIGCAPEDRGVLRVSGQITAPVTQPGSRIGGRVLEVLVAEGDAVQAGQVLLRLDPAEAEAKLAAARAQLAQAQAVVDKLTAGATPEQLRQAEAAAEAARQQYLAAQRGARAQELAAAAAATEAARAQRDAARDDRNRLEKLIGNGAVTERQFEQAKAAAEAAEAQWRAAREREGLVVDGLRDEEIAAARAQADRLTAALDELRAGARAEDRAAAEAARDAAAAQVRLAEVNLGEMTVQALEAGVVEAVDLRPGDLLRPGAALRIMRPNDLELTVYVGAAALGSLQIGQSIPLTADAHGPRRFTGTVTYIAAEGEFTPRNLQTQEERLRQVFAVRLRLDPAEGALRPGMTATLHIARQPGGA